MNGELKIYVTLDSKKGPNAIAIPQCEKARLFCCIAKQNVLEASTLKYLEKLGYEVVVVKKTQGKDANLSPDEDSI